MLTTAQDYSAEERAAWRDAAIARAKAEILWMIRLGRIPAGVRSFTDLHDHIDANELGGLCEDGPMAPLVRVETDEGMAFANAVQDAVHAWLVSRAAEAEAARERLAREEDALRVVAARIDRLERQRGA